MCRLHVFILMFLFCIASCSFSHLPKEPILDTIFIDDNRLSEGFLHMTLPERHPANLSIQSPNGIWFVLQDSESGITLLPQKTFDASRVLEFKLNDIVGVTWTDSVKSTEMVFVESGRYLIYFADNLETEPENTYSLQSSILFSN